MSNPQQSGSQHNQATDREKQGPGHQQQQQPDNQKSGQQDNSPGKQGQQPQPGHGNK